MHKRWISFLLAMVMVLGLLSGGMVTVSAASELKTSENAIKLIKEFEGFQATPKSDYSQWSVGYGSACEKDDYPNGITEEEADKLLRTEIAKLEVTINKFADKNGLTLKQNQFDALISFTYNVGSNWVNDSEGAFRQAVVSGATGSDFLYGIVRWCVAGVGDNKAVQRSLVDRRLAEANLYLNGVYSRGVPANYTYVIYNNNLDNCTNTVRIQGYDSTGTVKPLANPTRKGYRFLGWYTKANGGEPVTLFSHATAGITVHGHWQEGDGTKDSEGNVVGVAALYTVYAAVSGKQPVYEQPNTEAKQLKTLDANAEVTVTAEYIEADGSKWGKISGGWICLKDASEELQPEQALEQALEVTVNTNGVNLRVGPGTNYEKVGTANKGQKLTITGTTKTKNNTWGKFDGGWICLSYTDFESAKAESSADANKVTAIGKIVNADKVNVRSGPGTSYSVAGSYSLGEQMYITLQEKVGGTVWYKTEKGWVHSYYVKATAVEAGSVPDLTPTTPTEPEVTTPTEPEATTPTEPDTTTPTTPDASDKEEKIQDVGTVVNCATLNVRSGAGTKNPKVASLLRGSQVTIVAYTKVNGVTWGQTEKGWVSMEYIQLNTGNSGTTGDTSTTGSTGTVVNCTKVNVRSGAGTNHSKVTQLTKGTTVQILETTKVNGVTWARTAQGWIHTYYLSITSGNTAGSGSTTGSTGTATNATGVVVNSGKVNVRSDAGTQYSKVTQLSKGTTVQILEQKKATNGALWYRTAQGWIHGHYLKVTGTVGTTTDTTTGNTTGTGNTTDSTAGSTDSVQITTYDGAAVSLTGTIVNTDTLRVRSGAGTQNAQVATLAKGEKVEILELKTVNRSTWGRTAKGWISLYYVKLDSTTSANGAVVKTVSTDLLHIRDKAGATEKQTGDYRRGNLIVILEQTSVNGAAWGRTDQGWVAMEYLK